MRFVIAFVVQDGGKSFVPLDETERENQAAGMEKLRMQS